MRKKFLILFLILIIFSISSCGTTSEEYNPPQTERNISNDESGTSENGNEKLPQKTNSLDSTKTDEQIPEKSSNKPETEFYSTAKEPDEIELMTYAQTVLDDYFPECKYSRRKDEYTFIKTDLRYKIEGNVSIDDFSEKFYMIIKFTNDDFEFYDLISLQIGDEIIYESSSENDLPVPENTNDNEILSEENTKIYNEVMDKLNSDYSRAEDEILEEIAPDYNMNAAQLKEFMYNYQEAYFQ